MNIAGETSLLYLIGNISSVESFYVAMLLLLFYGSDFPYAKARCDPCHKEHALS